MNTHAPAHVMITPPLLKCITSCPQSSSQRSFFRSGMHLFGNSACYKSTGGKDGAYQAAYSEVSTVQEIIWRLSRELRNAGEVQTCVYEVCNKRITAHTHIHTPAEIDIMDLHDCGFTSVSGLINLCWDVIYINLLYLVCFRLTTLEGGSLNEHRATPINSVLPSESQSSADCSKQQLYSTHCNTPVTLSVSGGRTKQQCRASCPPGVHVPYMHNAQDGTVRTDTHFPNRTIT